ncbi:MAG: hypothetical protein J0I99_18000 [Devosia sp.]|uniref:hypothetical protein n=1 Tax=Devosia sp. TaxID=1871048 RepID=UPI001AC051C3|nr:hypothetical protein [Devosia sp.]MBN9317639.1 hypothetical protein [Devosia sp.]
MGFLLKARPLTVATLIATGLLGGSSQGASDAISDSVCSWPVNLERAGILDSWRPKEMWTPYAIESEDGRSWLYVPGGNPVIISGTEFDAYKHMILDALRQVIPNLQAIDGGSALTVTYEDEDGIAGSPERRAYGARFTLVDGCVVRMVLTMQGSAPVSDALQLLDLVTLSR